VNTIELKQACWAKLEQLPEDKLRETLNFLSQQLSASLTTNTVKKTPKKLKPEDLVGRLQYQGKPKSLEEIETALQAAIAKEWLENERN
jgi:hypothetical protein